MVPERKHKQFFRIRTPVCLEGYGVRKDMYWLFGSIVLLDFNMKTLIKEAITINQIVPGVFSFSDLLGMNYDDYELVIQEMKRINKKDGR